MKCHLIKIISIFFVFTALFLSPAAASQLLVPGMELAGEVSGYDRQFLRSVLRQLDRYARIARISRTPGSITVICGRNERSILTQSRLYLPGDAGVWQETPALRRQIYGALAAARFNFRFPANSPGVPEWIVNGIEAEIATAVTSGQYLAANRDFRLLSEFAGLYGELPDFRIMCRTGIPADPVLQKFFAEQARILLQIMAENGRIKELFQKTCNGEQADCFTAFYRDQESAKESIADAAGLILWNQYRPMPVKTVRSRLAELEHFFIPETDENGKETGNFKTVNSWREFAAALKTFRGNRSRLQNQFAARYILLGKMLSIQEKNICAELAAGVNSFTGDGEEWEEAEKRFAGYLAKLHTQLDRREKIDRFFRDTMMLNAPLPDTFQLLFEAAGTKNLSLSPEEKKFLQQTVNRYLL